MLMLTSGICCEDGTTYPIDFRGNVVYLMVFVRAILTFFALRVQIKVEKTTLMGNFVSQMYNKIYPGILAVCLINLLYLSCRAMIRGEKHILMLSYTSFNFYAF